MCNSNNELTGPLYEEDVVKKNTFSSLDLTQFKPSICFGSRGQSGEPLPFSALGSSVAAGKHTTLTDHSTT